MIENDWWRSFFSGVVVDFWLSVPNVEQNRSEADYIQRLFRLAPGARVLDVPCGGGRHAVELAARGFEVSGVDLSPEFLEAARTAATARGSLHRVGATRDARPTLAAKVRRRLLLR